MNLQSIFNRANQLIGRSRDRDAFTLIELLVVILLLGVLLAIIAPSFLSAADGVRHAEAQSNLATAYKIAQAERPPQPDARFPTPPLLYDALVASEPQMKFNMSGDYPEDPVPYTVYILYPADVGGLHLYTVSEDGAEWEIVLDRRGAMTGQSLITRADA